jgi:PKHD-type hydroxylase
MRLNTNYYWFNAALSRGDCNRFINLGLSQTATAATTAQVADATTRDSSIVWLDEPWIYELLQPWVIKANALAGWNWDWDFSEAAQFTIYAQNQYNDWHSDSDHRPYELFNADQHELSINAAGESQPADNHVVFNRSAAGKIRKLSLVCNLSDPDSYAGGDLQFDFGYKQPVHTCTELRNQGSIVVFPSHLLHRLTPITAGTRYSLVLWNLGLPFR